MAENKTPLDDFVSEFLVSSRVWRWFVDTGRVKDIKVAEKVREYYRKYQEEVIRGEASLRDYVESNFRSILERLRDAYDEEAALFLPEDTEQVIDCLISIVGLYAFLYCLVLDDASKQEVLTRSLETMERTLSNLGLNAQDICRLAVGGGDGCELH